MKMKKIFIVSLLSLTIPFFTFAATPAGLTPKSPFYFLDTLFEKINLALTFNPEKKATKALLFAEERLAEANTDTEKSKPEVIESLMANYKANIDLATEKSKEIKDEAKTEELLNKLADNTAKHQEVLTEVLAKVPEVAKEAIENALKASRKNHEEALKQVAELRQEVIELKQEVAELKKQQKVEVTSPQPITQEPTIKELKAEIENLKKQSTKKIEQKEQSVISAISKISTSSTIRTKIILKSVGSDRFELKIINSAGIKELSFQPTVGAHYGGKLVSCLKEFETVTIFYPQSFPLKATITDCQNNVDELNIPSEGEYNASVLLKLENPSDVCIKYHGPDSYYDENGKSCQCKNNYGFYKETCIGKWEIETKLKSDKALEDFLNRKNNECKEKFGQYSRINTINTNQCLCDDGKTYHIDQLGTTACRPSPVPKVLETVIKEQPVTLTKEGKSFSFDIPSTNKQKIQELIDLGYVVTKGELPEGIIVRAIPAIPAVPATPAAPSIPATTPTTPAIPATPAPTPTPTPPSSPIIYKDLKIIARCNLSSPTICGESVVYSERKEGEIQSQVKYDVPITLSVDDPQGKIVVPNWNPDGSSRTNPSQFEGNPVTALTQTINGNYGKPGLSYAYYPSNIGAEPYMFCSNTEDPTCSGFRMTRTLTATVNDKTVTETFTFRYYPPLVSITQIPGSSAGSHTFQLSEGDYLVKSLTFKKAKISGESMPDILFMYLSYLLDDSRLLPDRPCASQASIYIPAENAADSALAIKTIYDALNDEIKFTIPQPTHCKKFEIKIGTAYGHRPYSYSVLYNLIGGELITTNGSLAPSVPNYSTTITVKE